MGTPSIRFSHHSDCGCGCGGHGGATSAGDTARNWSEVPDEEVVCHCAQVCKREIVEAIRNGAYTVPLIKILKGVGRGHPCPNDHKCLEDVRELIRTHGTTTLSDALVPIDEDATE